MAVMASRKRSAISGDVTKFIGKLKRTKAPCAGRLEPLDVMRKAVEVLTIPRHSIRGTYMGM